MSTKASPSDYRFSDAKRSVVLPFGFAITVLGIVVALIGGSRVSSPKPGDDPGVAVAGVIAGILMVLVGLRTAVCSPKLGRLRIYRDYAELPRLGLAPWCLLSPHQVPFSRIRRWVIAKVELDTTETILVFELHAGTTRIEKLPLSNYSDPPTVSTHFLHQLQPPARVEIGANFGGARFLD